MSRSSLALFLLPLVGCAPTWMTPESAEVDPLMHASCDPLMEVFPVGDAHNIGYDHSSCGTGTCEISCPDHNANSDWGGSHHGIDVFAYQGAPLVAVTGGEIVAVGTPSSTSGLRVRLRDACGWEYYYGHMDAAYVSTGQWVSAGDVIGTMGHTGTASTHLHFNVSPDGSYYDDIDPIDLLVDTSATACGAPPVEPDPEPDPAPAGCGTANGNTVLNANEGIWSCDGRFALIMQGDGNLVLYYGWSAIWSTGTHGNPGAWMSFQGDGNLVVYSAWGTPLWDAGTHGHPGSVLAVQDDGNLVIYDGWSAIWNTGTHGY